MTTDISDDSIVVLCMMLRDIIKVNPDAQPAVMLLIEAPIDNHVRQEPWGPILCRAWQELKGASGAEVLHRFPPCLLDGWAGVAHDEGVGTRR
jgi:hypothetical protein